MQSHAQVVARFDELMCDKASKHAIVEVRQELDAKCAELRGDLCRT